MVGCDSSTGSSRGFFYLPVEKSTPGDSSFWVFNVVLHKRAWCAIMRK